MRQALPTGALHDLAGNVVATLTSENETVGAGSVDWDTNLPAASGIYTYRIFAEHWEDPFLLICADSDKSARLEISNVSKSDFEWIDVPTTAQVTLNYELNRDAAECTLRIYNNDLDEVTVVSPLGGALDAGAGPHTVVVVFEDTGRILDRYRFVISAEETTGDGELNRDLQPKPALQKGANHKVRTFDVWHNENPLWAFDDTYLHSDFVFQWLVHTHKIPYRVVWPPGDIQITTLGENITAQLTEPQRNQTATHCTVFNLADRDVTSWLPLNNGGYGGTRAHSGTPASPDVAWVHKQNWEEKQDGLNDAQSVRFFTRIYIHELGHALGLGDHINPQGNDNLCIMRWRPEFPRWHDEGLGTRDPWYPHVEEHRATAAAHIRNAPDG